MAYIEYERKRKIMYDYLTELDKIQGRENASPEDMEKWFNELAEEGIDGIAEWIDIRIKYRLVGQLIVCQYPDCHPDADYFISQAYIIPKARKHGLMTKTVTDFVITHPGTYCMLVCNGNIYALRFWDKLFASLGYEKIELTNGVAEKSNSIQIGYRKK